MGTSSGFAAQFEAEQHTVSIQLMSPASGDNNWTWLAGVWGDFTVSIQLMSPASGDNLEFLTDGEINKLLRFHSINVPSEWGLQGMHYAVVDNGEA